MDFVECDHTYKCIKLLTYLRSHNNISVEHLCSNTNTWYKNKGIGW